MLARAEDAILSPLECSCFDRGPCVSEGRLEPSSRLAVRGQVAVLAGWLAADLTVPCQLQQRGASRRCVALPMVARWGQLMNGTKENR